MFYISAPIPYIMLWIIYLGERLAEEDLVALLNKVSDRVGILEDIS
jgi:hypothetical protein